MSCWWSNILHVKKFFFLLFLFFFTCYLEPKLFRELTRKPTGSFSFLACTLFSLNLFIKLNKSSAVNKSTRLKYQLCTSKHNWHDRHKKAKRDREGEKSDSPLYFLLPHPPLLMPTTLPKGWQPKIFSYTVLENSMLAVLTRPTWKV